MSAEQDPRSEESTILPDFDLESVSLGPSTRMFTIEADPEGGIFYQFANRETKMIHFPDSFGLNKFLVIDMARAAAFLDPNTFELIGLAGYLSVGSRLFLMGEHWGKWLDEDGNLFHSKNPFELMRKWRLPVTIQEGKNLLSIDFGINVHHRESFTRSTLMSCRDERALHVMYLVFETPSGGFQKGRLSVRDPQTHRLLFVYDLEGIPLRLPNARAAEEAEAAMRNSARAARGGGRPIHARPGADNSRAPRPKTAKTTRSGASPAGPPSHAHPPSPDEKVLEATHRRVPATENISTHDLIGLLSTETNANRRWLMIEPNLMKGRPERTYPLILNHPDLIAERTADWPPGRLRLAFSGQPGAVLTAIMRNWTVNQVLAVAEDNAEPEKIQEWLRAREVERLLKVDLGLEPYSAEEARQILHVDRNADGAAVRKAWRTLLGFINVDHGRIKERAIHRRKDEIAKRLQTARDILLKVSS